MIDQDSNTDHIFKDELTDHEVNPPAEVWQNVQARIQTETHIFKDRLANYQVTPPAEIWEKIQARIQIRTWKLPVFYRVAAASVTFFLLAGSAWLLFFNEPAEQELAQVPTTIETGNTIEQPGLADEAGIEESVIMTGKESITPENPVISEQITSITGSDPEISGTENRLAMVAEKEENISGNQLEQETQPSESNLLLMTMRSETDPVLYNQLDLLTNTPSDLSRQFDTPLPIEKTTPLDIGNNPKWSVGGHVSPLYSFRYIGQSSQVSSRNNYNNNETGLVSYSGGINIKYNSNRKLSIYTGIYYSRLGQQVDDVQLYRSATNEPLNLPIKGNLDINNSLGTISSENDRLFFKDESANRVEPISLSETYDPVKEGLIPLNASIIQSLEYLEIPLIIRYKVIDRRFDFNILGGVSTNIMIDNNAYANYQGSKIHIGETNGLRTINYSSTLGIGLEYNITENVSFNLEPAFKFYINSINLDENVNTHPYAIGIFTGLNYNFK